MNIKTLSKRLIDASILAGPTDRRIMQEAAAATDELTAIVAAHEAELADLQSAYQRALRAPSIAADASPDAPEPVRCSGCGLRWTVPEGFLWAGVVHLCGDCWRKVQGALHA